MDEELSRLGRGMVQMNLRLGRVLSLLESRDPPGTAGSLAALLDLIDGVDQSLRALPPGDVATGLGLALARALDALAEMGLQPIGEGAFDPQLHHAVLAEPDAARAGQVARTLRRGWQRDGDPPTVLRPAHVAVWRAPEPRP
jgi:molecular chaperone GrpE (heat shock protein)